LYFRSCVTITKETDKEDALSLKDCLVSLYITTLFVFLERKKKKQPFAAKKKMHQHSSFFISIQFGFEFVLASLKHPLKVRV